MRAIPPFRFFLQAQLVLDFLTLTLALLLHCHSDIEYLAINLFKNCVTERVGDGRNSAFTWWGT